MVVDVYSATNERFGYTFILRKMNGWMNIEDRALKN